MLRDRVAALLGRRLPLKPSKGLLLRLAVEGNPLGRILHSPRINVRPDGPGHVLIHHGSIDRKLKASFTKPKDSLYPDLTFRPDYEVPVRAVVDHVLARPEVDPDRLAFLGLSFGGYFSIRATAHEPRIKALIPNSPIIDLYRYMAAFLGYSSVEADQDLTPDEVAELPGDVASPTDKWGLFNICRRFGVPGLGAYFEFLEQFRVGPELKNITCPTLALVGEGEGDEALAQEYIEGVSGPRRLYRFTVAEGADTHCQLNNLSFSNHVAFDWLDELFD